MVGRIIVMIISIIIGVAVVFGLFCLIVLIGSKINGLTFSEQICIWFCQKLFLKLAI